MLKEKNSKGSGCHKSQVTGYILRAGSRNWEEPTGGFGVLGMFSSLTRVVLTKTFTL